MSPREFFCMWVAGRHVKLVGDYGAMYVRALSSCPRTEKLAFFAKSTGVYAGVALFFCLGGKPRCCRVFVSRWLLVADKGAGVEFEGCHRKYIFLWASAKQHELRQCEAEKMARHFFRCSRRNAKVNQVRTFKPSRGIRRGQKFRGMYCVDAVFEHFSRHAV